MIRAMKVLTSLSPSPPLREMIDVSPPLLDSYNRDHKEEHHATTFWHPKHWAEPPVSDCRSHPHGPRYPQYWCPWPSAHPAGGPPALHSLVGSVAGTLTIRPGRGS